jgi:predicted PurR-regulated permease PerM
MTPLSLLLLALMLVIGGVLLLRFPPFVVLIAAAFIVATLTPPVTVARQKDRTANGTFASISPVTNSRTVGFGYPFTPSPGLSRPVNVRKG